MDSALFITAMGGIFESYILTQVANNILCNLSAILTRIISISIQL